APAGAVGVEGLGLDAVLDEVPARRARHLDGAGRRDVIGGDRDAEDAQHPGAVDVLHGLRLGGHVHEVGGLADVGGVRVPGVGVTLGDVEAVPVLVAPEDVGV